MAASMCPIAISDDEDGPVSPDKLVPPPSDAGRRVNGPRDSDADSVQSSEEYDYAPPDNYIDLNDVSLHLSDIEEEDIFADNLKRFTELQRQTAERLAAEPVPLSPTPESRSGAAKRPAPKTVGGSKRRRTESPEAEDDDDDLDLEKLLGSSPATPTRQTRSGRSRNTPVTQLSDTEDDKAVVAESPVCRPESAISVPEEPEEPERTFTARVQVGRLIIRLQMKRTERLQRLFDAVADELSLPARRVCLGQRDVIYSPHQTPHDVGLGPFDVIEFWEGTSAPAAAPAAAAVAVDPDSVELKVQSSDRRSTVTLRLRRSDPMSLLMERYATERGVPLKQLRFRFDGDALDPTDTPETLDLEGGECVDVHGC